VEGKEPDLGKKEIIEEEEKVREQEM